MNAEDQSESPFGMVFPQDEKWGGRLRRKGGMDLLEYYTGKALIGILANATVPLGRMEVKEEEARKIAREAVTVAIETMTEIKRARRVHGEIVEELREQHNG